MSEHKFLNGLQLARILIRLMAIYIFVSGLYWAAPNLAFFLSLMFWNDETVMDAMNGRMFIVSLVQPLIKIFAAVVLWFGTGWFSQRVCPPDAGEIETPVTADMLKSMSVFIAGLVLLYVVSKWLISALMSPFSGHVLAVILPLAIPMLIALGMVLFPDAVVNGIAKIAGAIGRKRNRF